MNTLLLRSILKTVSIANNDASMKWYLAFILVFSFLIAIGQTLDTLRVRQLIDSSRRDQWIDSHRSLQFAEEALTLAQALDDRKGIATAHNLKGFCFWTFGDNDLAIQSALEALRTSQVERYEGVQAESYYILARGYMDLAERAKARESIRIAETLARNAGRWELLSSIYNLRGVLFFIDNKTDSARYFYQNAFETGQQHGIDSIHYPRIISNIGECYAAENLTLAFTYYRQALALAKKTGNAIAEASITDIVGHAFLRTGDLANAETHLTLALQQARRLGLRRVVRHAYSGLVDIKLRQNKGSEAVVYLRRYYDVRDSLLNTSKIRQIVELEAKHTLELKEQSIKLLEKEARLRTLWNNVLIALVLLLIITLAALYQLQQYRYRKNREILNLEIDYLTRRHQESMDKYKAALQPANDESLESYDQKLLRKAIALVEENIGDPLFGVEKMADEMSMSRTNLHRKLKAISGFPPSELIRSIRLRKAARLIAAKADTITQIALSVGFDDYSHFSKAFKKHFGVSPTAYEEQPQSV